MIEKFYLVYWRILILGLILVFFASCTTNKSVDVNYSFSVSTNVSSQINEYENVKFEPFEKLNLGFYRGNIWIKININNTKKENMSCMFISNDKSIRNYTFYKLNSINKFELINHVNDSLKQDYRTYNNPNPNLKIDLLPNEKATYLITTSGDGRAKDVTPQIISLQNYFSFIKENTILSIIFYSIIIFLLLVNIYLWSIYKKELYFYYILYILSTFFVYLGLEGYLNCLKISQIIIDHFIFIWVKLWVWSLIMYTSNFFELQTLAPKYYRFIKVSLVLLLGGTLLYQLIFYKSSIQYLHYFENSLIPLWLFLIVGILVLSIKNRSSGLKYYLIPLSIFIVFTVFGIINAHLQIFPGNSFTYVKVGAIFEFVGFTYFTTLLIKRKLVTRENLKKELDIKIRELVEKNKKLDELHVLLESRTKFEKTDLLNIFSLLENSLNNSGDWEFFKNSFKELNPNFLNKLTELHPDLSKSDLRLLILIRIGYTQKEIASILNIASESVKKARTRVRKKLNLSEVEKLNEYLCNF